MKKMASYGLWSSFFAISSLIFINYSYFMISVSSAYKTGFVGERIFFRIADLTFWALCLLEISVNIFYWKLHDQRRLDYVVDFFVFCSQSALVFVTPHAFFLRVPAVLKLNSSYRKIVRSWQTGSWAVLFYLISITLWFLEISTIGLIFSRGLGNDDKGFSVFLEAFQKSLRILFCSKDFFASNEQELGLTIFIEFGVLPILATFFLIFSFRKAIGLARWGDWSSSLETIAKYYGINTGHVESEEISSLKENEILSVLPESKRDEICYQIMQQFHQLNKVFSGSLLMALHKISERKKFGPNELIKNIAGKLILVATGELRLAYKSTDQVTLDRFPKSTVYGTFLFYDPPKEDYLQLVTGDSFSILLFISLERFLETLAGFPSDYEKFCSEVEKTTCGSRNPSAFFGSCPVCKHYHACEGCIKNYFRNESFLRPQMPKPTSFKQIRVARKTAPFKRRPSKSANALLSSKLFYISNKEHLDYIFNQSFREK